MSDWHDELEFALLPLEDAKIDSDCMTSVISNALREQCPERARHLPSMPYRIRRGPTEPNGHCSPLLDRARTGLVY
ncbi:Hypothetical protein KpB31_5142 [Klebsiella pneumoniae]|nr:Hypothetical protein KpB31_5142 [Klebsiella pneumoniae]